MKKYQLIWLLTISVAFALSCKKELPNPTPKSNPVDSTFKVVWQVPLRPDSGECVSISPVLFNNKAIFSTGASAGPEVLSAYNIFSGAKEWEWSDYSGSEEITNHNGYVRYNDRLIICTDDHVYSINLNDGATVWASPISENINGISLFGDYIYRCCREENSFFPHTKAYMFRAHAESGIWDTVYTETAADGYSPFIQPPTGYIGHDYDTILLFQNYAIDYSSLNERIDIIAYNFNKKKTNFRLYDLEPGISGYNPRSPIVISNYQAYLLGSRTLFAFSLANEYFAWKKNFNEPGEDLHHGHLLMTDYQLLVKTSGDYLYGVDPDAGGVIRWSLKTGIVRSPMIFNGGLAYTVGEGYIRTIIPLQGYELRKLQSPNANAHFNSTGVVVDLDHQYLFTADTRFGMCIKIP